ncbi:MAG: UDP-N-acetylmuramate dehydrogenase [Micromonosporaceae bacterium]|nr:UDP-N-acetylmuramate dehydrogenase [Micromonosporaceae bacterium]
MLDAGETLLADHTTLRLGGHARRVLIATDRHDVVQAVRDTEAAAEPLLLLAGGSNVVIADEGFPGTALLIRSTGIGPGDGIGPAGGATSLSGTGIRPAADGDGELVTIEAGAIWDEVVQFCLAEGLSGVECMSGIPGSAGGTPIQNVGAYGHEIAELLDSVEVYDRHRGEVVRMAPGDCRLGFRTSVFKRADRYIVLAVTLRLQRSPLSAPVQYAELATALGARTGDRVPAEEVRSAVLKLRAGKGMVLDPADPDTWSVGSFFANPLVPLAGYPNVAARAQARAGGSPPHWPYGPDAVKVSAAWLIERAGFGKGYRGQHRGVAISTKHTLALTNLGGGSTAALLGLAREIREGVRDAFGVTLEPEAVLVGCEL